jgi:hypothetical protein
MPARCLVHMTKTLVGVQMHIVKGIPHRYGAAVIK